MPKTQYRKTESEGCEMGIALGTEPQPLRSDESCTWYLSCIGEWSAEAHCRIACWLAKSLKVNDPRMRIFLVRSHKTRHRQEDVARRLLSCLGQ